MRWRTILRMESGRRQFVKQALSWLLALLGLGFLLPGATLFAPLERKQKDLVFFPLVREDEVPRSGVKKGELIYTSGEKERKARVFVVSSPGGMLVLSATCSHLGCLVNYHKDKAEFICPCHGGRYDLTGRNIGGPPPMPLTAFPFRIADGMVMVGVKV